MSYVSHIGEWSGNGEGFKPESQVYNATCTSLHVISAHDHGESLGELLAALVFFDLPATMVLDTALLPIDLTLNTLAYLDEGSFPSAPYCSVLTGS